MPDAPGHDTIPSPNLGADAPGTTRTAPAPGRPGSLPFTPYGGTTAPYRPKADSAAKPRATKTFPCDQCRASGFATPAELDEHRRSAHPAPGGTAAEGASDAAETPPGERLG